MSDPIEIAKLVSSNLNENNGMLHEAAPGFQTAQTPIKVIYSNIIQILNTTQQRRHPQSNDAIQEIKNEVQEYLKTLGPLL